jgi:hypothetical protein
VLVELDHFEPTTIVVGLTAALFALLGIVGIVRLRGESKGSSSKAVPSGLPLSRAWTIVGGLVLAGAIWLRASPINHLRGGQDPGVYVNIANFLARSSSLKVQDPLAPLLASQATPLGKEYFKSSYRAISCDTPESCHGAFQPGFYLHSISPSRITPQFYHLHPIWMAFSNLAFGAQYTTAVLVAFGVLSVLVFFAIVREVLCYRWSAVLAAGILALCPAHAYFSRFPVSEITASLFFLGSTLYLVRGRFVRLPESLVAALFVGAYCFTHITGFIFFLLIFPATALAQCYSKNSSERLVGVFGWGLSICLFVWSYLHGLALSHPYSMAIWSKIGFPERGISWSCEHPVLFTLIFTLCSLLPVLAAPLCYRVLCSLKFFPISRRWLVRAACGGLVLFGLFLCYKAYLLGFTDHYAESRGIGRRWRLAGEGWWAVRHMRAVVLLYFVSPFVVILSIFGWLRMSGRSFADPVAFFLFSALAGLTVALVGGQLIVPFLYYFGRYLVAALVPMIIIFAVYGLERLRLARPMYTRGVRVAVVLLVAGYLLPYAIAQARSYDGPELFLELKRLSNTVGNRAVVFIDEVQFPSIEITAPLRLTFGVPTITYSRREQTPESLRALMLEASALGFDVYLLSGKDRGTKFSFLVPQDTFKFFLPIFVPKDDQTLIPTVQRNNKYGGFLHRFIGSNREPAQQLP